MFELNHSIIYFLLNISPKEQTTFSDVIFIVISFYLLRYSVKCHSTKTAASDKILYVDFGFFLVLFLSILSRPP